MAEGISAPIPQVITSKQDRRNYGVGIPYADAYNQSAMAQYNNEYNYWLWKQQIEYNSPVEQRKRLEAAGLNPNYNSIDSGNIGSIPSSSGSISPSIGSNRRISLDNAVTAVNAIVSNIAQGIKSVSQLSGIPDNISMYRKLLTMTARGKLDSQALDNALKTIQRDYNNWYYRGVDVGGYIGSNNLSPDGGQVFERSNITGSPAGRQANLRNESMVLLNALRDFDLSHIKPEEENLIKQRVRQVSAQAGISEKQLKWFEGLKGAQIGLAILSLLK